MGFGKDGKGVIIREIVDITVGALADNSCIKQTAGGLGSDLNEDFRLIKTEYYIHANGWQAGEGPVYVGVANNELTTTEIAESLTISGPQDRSDRLNEEKATRATWLFGSINASDAYRTPEGTPPQEKSLRWTFTAGDGWTWFAHNNSGGTLTTGLVIRIIAKHFGVWVT